MEYSQGPFVDDYQPFLRLTVKIDTPNDYRAPERVILVFHPGGRNFPRERTKKVLTRVLEFHFDFHF